MKPLDLVKTPKGGLAIVTEVGKDGSASIDYLFNQNPAREKNAWWRKGDGLKVIDSIPRLIANAMAHPAGDLTSQGDRFFGKPEIA